MNTIPVKIQLDPGATIPTRAHETDVGYDVTALKTTLLDEQGNKLVLSEYNKRDFDRYIHVSSFNGSSERLWLQYNKVIIDTGVHVRPADGYYCEIVPNSRLSKTGLSYGNSIGIIDPGYTGSIKVILNISHTATYKDLLTFLPGNVVGQLILRPLLTATFEQVDKLDTTERGDGGFGSTANK